jgi:hypothetical protein
VGRAGRSGAAPCQHCIGLRSRTFGYRELSDLVCDTSAFEIDQSLAYQEEDGTAFLIAMIAPGASLAITAATVWGTVETIDWIDSARHK